MTTRFYLSATAVPSQTPGFDGGWTRTSEGARRAMSSVKDGSTIASATFWANAAAAANATCLSRQFIGPPMAAGVAFVTTDTFKCYMRAMESATNDNINRDPICIKVLAANGSTIQATLKALGHYGPNTTEWNSSLRNKTFGDGDVLGANYTTVDGDCLLIEVGGQVDATGGTSVTGTLSFGSSSGTDLGENESDTAANNPWFESSRTITFLATGTSTLALPLGGSAAGEIGWCPLTPGTNSSVAPNATSLSATCGPVAVGDTICVAVCADTNDGSTSDVIDDDLGNTYVVKQTTTDTTKHERISIALCIVTVAGTPTVRLRFNPTPGTTTADNCSINVDPFSGSVAGSIADGGAAQVQAAPGTGTDAVTSGTYTTTVDGDLVYAACVHTTTGADPGSVGTGFRLAQNSGNIVLKTEFSKQATQSASTAGTLTTAAGADRFETASLAVTPTAAGISGTSTLALPLGGSATGTVDVAATTSLALPLGGTLAGVVAIAAICVLALPFGGSATGTVGSGAEAHGDSTLALPLAGSAAGTVEVKGTSTTALPFGGSAAGAVEIRGTSSVTLLIGTSSIGYFTTFPATENPISEGGRWIQDDSLQTPVQTTGGAAYGTQADGPNGPFDDSEAYMTGFGNDYEIEATIERVNGLAMPPNKEVELLLRWSVGALRSTAFGDTHSYGYEINVAYNGNYLQLGRFKAANLYDQPLGSTPATGDKFRARIEGQRIRAWWNDVLKIDVTDNDPALMIPTGNPGIGFFWRTGAGNTDFGFSDVIIRPLARAAGTVGPGGSSTLALPLGGSAAGTVQVQGSSTLALPRGGTTTGTVEVRGTSTQPLPFGGSATGTVGAGGASGTSTLALPLAGSAAGTVQVQGTSTLALPLGGSATSVHTVLAASTLALPLGGSATATVEIRGASAVGLPLGGSATGATTPLGVPGPEPGTASFLAIGGTASMVAPGTASLTDPSTTASLE